VRVAQRLRRALGGFGREGGEAVDERRSETGIEATERVARELGDEPLGELATESHGEPVYNRLVIIWLPPVDLGDIGEEAS